MLVPAPTGQRQVMAFSLPRDAACRIFLRPAQAYRERRIVLNVLLLERDTHVATLPVTVAS